MKTALISIAALTITLSSCYKSKCHTCTTKTYKNGIEQRLMNPQIKYCDKTRKEVEKMEGTYKSSYYDTTAGTIIEYVVTTTCD